MRGWTQGEVGECKTESQSLRSLLHTLGGGDGRDTSDTGGLILQWRKEETDRKVIVEFRLEGVTNRETTPEGMSSLPPPVA